MALCIAPSTVSQTPPSSNTALAPGLLTKFTRYRAKLQDRVDHLESGQHEIPISDNDDLRMPSLLKKWNGDKKATQPPGNYVSAKGSCKFDADRIAQYKTFAAENFARELEKPAPGSLTKLAKLLVLEIAYVNARQVQWVPKTPAHMGEAGTGDDDEPPSLSSDGADFDFINDWSITDPGSIPWSNLRLSNLPDNILKVGHTPAYMLPALLIAHSVQLRTEPPPEDMVSYWNSCEAQLTRVVQLRIDDYLGLCEAAARTDRNYMKLMPREYTDAEMEYIAELWLAAKDDNH